MKNTSHLFIKKTQVHLKKIINKGNKIEIAQGYDDNQRKRINERERYSHQAFGFWGSIWHKGHNNFRGK